MPRTLGELADIVGGRLDGDPKTMIEGIASLETAQQHDISFVASRRFWGAASKSSAGCLVIPTNWPAMSGKHAFLRVSDVNRATAVLTETLLPSPLTPEAGIHPKASVAATAVLGTNVHIGPCAVVGERASIGDNTHIRAGAVVADEVVIGDNCDIYEGVVVRERVRIGDRVRIHPNSVIGADGFGYRELDGVLRRMPHRGSVHIGNDVEIGSCVTIDRARFELTRVADHAKIDNLVQIAHNADVGEGAIIVSMVALAGSVRIGRGCEIGGQAAIREHVRLGDRSRIAAKAGVTRNVPSGREYGGYPAIPHERNKKNMARFSRLSETIDKLSERLRKLELKRRKRG